MCKRQLLDRKARHIKFVDSHRIRRSFASTISVWWCRTLSILGTTHTLASVLGCLSESCMGGVHTHKQRKGDRTFMNDKRRRQDQGWFNPPEYSTKGRHGAYTADQFLLEQGHEVTKCLPLRRQPTSRVEGLLQTMERAAPYHIVQPVRQNETKSVEKRKG